MNGWEKEKAVLGVVVEGPRLGRALVALGHTSQALKAVLRI